MRLSYNWLKNYMDLSDTTPEQLAEAITRGGHEVEEITHLAEGTNLVIGKVLECVEHPDSDHLHVCKVDVGTDVRQIVCGAPNVAAGQKVIVALPGAVLPGGTISAGKIRGQESNGMICALFELGVDRKHLTEAQLSGIEVLPEDAKIGNTNVFEYLHLDDSILEVSLTPNRADCLALWSAAKDIGAILDKKVTLPDYSYTCEYQKPTLTVASETEKCPLFEGKIVNHVTIKPSPAWLSEALTAHGIKSINNVVDISNFVMLETGQPLHFYDLAKIPHREITVKDNLEEVYKTLDGFDYHVQKDDIMITTGGQAIGIAGIMGGDDSKIDEETHGIIIEAAKFNSVSIRNTARRVNLQTDAASHFQKGIDPLAGNKAIERSVQLLIELADASGIEETVVCGKVDYSPVVINASVKKINAILGTEFSKEQIKSVFDRLDFETKQIDEDIIETHIPSYRWDITIQEDLAEEVIRILGYDNVKSTLPLLPTVQGHLQNTGVERRAIKAVLNGEGYSEIITYSLVSKEKTEEGILQIGKPVEISNPLSDERRYFRTSLASSMLETLSYNIARNNDELALFEIANVYDDDGKAAQHLSLGMSLKSTISNWQKMVYENDFYTMKGTIIAILKKLGYDERRVSFKPYSGNNNTLNPNKSAEVWIDRNCVGAFGNIHPLTARKYDIGEFLLGEIDLTAVLANKTGKVRFEQVNRFPDVSYDIALLVDDSTSAEQITSVIKKAGGNLLKKVEIFDVYKGANIPEGKKSMAISVTYQSNEKTLSESDIAPAHKEILSQLSGKLNAVLRES
ncbi:MAG: phenylalanine--tRNA ligase subunit beta [Erysipelotrichaceae bacterium]|nr:phenylalanine--tRNA ligase subunit beta [Erysipelotrichaceae bacterium]